jgi:hypothetical protein
MDTQDIVGVLIRHIPELDAYMRLREAVGNVGLGRVRACVEGALHQHMLILRRDLVREAGMNFHEVEKSADISVKRLGPRITLDTWLLQYAAFRKITGDSAAWDQIKVMLKS